MDNSRSSSGGGGGTEKVTAQFGRLSTNAAAWTPATSSQSRSFTSTTTTSNHSTSSTTTSAAAAESVLSSSDLSASKVKEFVPGKGWAATFSSAPTTPTTRTSSVPGLTFPNAAAVAVAPNRAHASSASSSSSAYMDPQQRQQQEEEQQQHHAHPKATTFASHGATPAPTPSFRAIHSLGVSDDTWNYFRDLSLQSIRQMDPTDERHKEVLPPFGHAYCLDDDDHDDDINNNNNDHDASVDELVGGINNNNNIISNSNSNKNSSNIKKGPISNNNNMIMMQRRSLLFGYPGRTFQVTNRDDGHLYCVHRFDHVRSVSQQIAATVSHQWQQSAELVEHPGIVPLFQCFVAQRAVFFVHAYIPGARSLAQQRLGPLSEPVMWSCIVQLLSAIQTVHQHNLAVRTLDLQHVLCTTDPITASRYRLRLNCVGILDALEFEARKSAAELQRQDLHDLGWLLLSLATGTDLTLLSQRSGGEREHAATLASCRNYLQQHFSRELHQFILALVQTHHSPPTLQEMNRVLAPHVRQENTLSLRQVDFMERLLQQEYESARLLRLLLKLGFVNERPEFGHDRRWSASGDCYVLTLFRDYVFHQADGSGFPVMDLGHVLTTLNKLDAASPEQLILVSRDGKSLMVVTYADVATCLENAYAELCSHHVPPSALLYS